jgi:ferredoxin
LLRLTPQLVFTAQLYFRIYQDLETVDWSGIHVSALKLLFANELIMTYTINDGCISCNSCGPLCPNGAIKSATDWEGYWIDPTLCDGCPDLDIPLCVASCDVGSLVPLPPKKGRYKSTLLPAAIPDIFLNGKTTPFASSMVVWEACNILAQGPALPWQTDENGQFCYRRPVHRGRGEMQFRLAANPEATLPEPMAAPKGTEAIADLDIRATCIHLIFAAHAITVDRPWQDAFVINDQHIEQYLGLDKRKDLTKLQKLTLIKTLVHQSCQILVAVNWPSQGKVQAFNLPEHLVWHLLDTQYYFEEDPPGRTSFNWLRIHGACRKLVPTLSQ